MKNTIVAKALAVAVSFTAFTGFLVSPVAAEPTYCRQIAMKYCSYYFTSPNADYAQCVDYQTDNCDFADDANYTATMCAYEGGAWCQISLKQPKWKRFEDLKRLGLAA